MTDITLLYAINDELTALSRELHVRFSSEEVEDAVLDELTHAIAVRFGLEPAHEAAAETNARGTASSERELADELAAINETMLLLAERSNVPGFMGAVPRPADDELLDDLTHLVARRFGYAV